ncbi:MAG: M55 family metallopeptidase [Clostridia bacterium]
MIHDTEAGEILLDASIAGDYGKPVILVAGDDYACAEAERQIPGVVTAQLKEAMSCYGASMLSPSAAYALLRKSCRSRHRVSVHTTYCTAKTCGSLAGIDRTRQLPHPETKPYMKITGPRSYQVEGSSVAEALFRLF